MLNFLHAATGTCNSADIEMRGVCVRSINRGRVTQLVSKERDSQHTCVRCGVRQ